MNLTVNGDRELWLYRNGENCFPLFVNPCETFDKRYYCIIRPALHPDLKEFEALQKHFGMHTVGLEKSHWIVDAAIIEKLLERAPGVTPEYYYLWDGKRKNPENFEGDGDTFNVDVKVVKPSAEAQSFLEYVFDETHVTDMDTLQGIWHCLQRYGAEWLYRKQRTLDLGFVKLDALPYRQNWKQIFLARFPGVARWFHLKRAERNANLELHPGTSQCIRGSWMIELDPKEWFAQWIVEARPTMAWRDYVAENERRRYRHYSRFAYAAWWRSTINRLEHKIYDILGDFIVATARPCAGMPPSDVHGRTHLVPKTPKGRISPQGEGYIFTHIVSVDPTVDMADSGELGEVEFPLAPLQQLPAVQPAIEDVRDGRGIPG